MCYDDVLLTKLLDAIVSPQWILETAKHPKNGDGTNFTNFNTGHNAAEQLVMVTVLEQYYVPCWLCRIDDHIECVVLVNEFIFC